MEKVNMQVLIDKDLHQWLDAEANKQGLKPSQIARMILIEAYQKALGK